MDDMDNSMGGLDFAKMMSQGGSGGLDMANMMQGLGGSGGMGGLSEDDVRNFLPTELRCA